MEVRNEHVGIGGVCQPALDTEPPCPPQDLLIVSEPQLKIDNALLNYISKQFSERISDCLAVYFGKRTDLCMDKTMIEGKQFHADNRGSC